MKYDNIKAWKELMPSLKLLTDAVNEEFKANLKALFEENPRLLSISIRINNHEFNDGDSTYFSLYYEDLTITDIDGVEHEYSYRAATKNEIHPLTQAVYDLFATYDSDNRYETLFGDAYECIAITRASVATNKIFTSNY